MPNSFKYSTGSETLALKKGNFYIGTGDVGKGPTSSTGYWNGITPPTGGYTIYANKDTNGPSIFVANNDTQLINFAKGFSGQNLTTVAQSLEWFATQTTYVCVNRDYESIITDGLVLNLDASFTPSYPTTNTTWYDVSVLSNNGTLINSPTYNVNGGGSIVFDGVDDSVTLGYRPSLNNTDITQEAWVNANSFSNGWHGIISNMPSWGTGFSLQIGTTQNIAAMVSGSYLKTSWTPSLNVWYHIVATHRSSDNLNILYVNGTQESSSNRSITYSSNAVTTIGVFYTSGSLPFSGEIKIIRTYNKALSESEVLQNYYGGQLITNGLVMSLDATNVVSYPGSGTSWKDLTSSGISGVLTNGPTFSYDGGGSLSFDRVDDYVRVTGEGINAGSFAYPTITCILWYKPGNGNSGSATSNNIITVENSFEISVGNNGDGTSSLYYASNPWAWRGTSSGVLTNNQWNMITYVHASTGRWFYVNGVEVFYSSESGNINLGSSSYPYMSLMGRYTGSTALNNGSLSMIHLYDRPLSADEVVQNFNTYKSRYGL